ncbi:MAG: FHA domain-containing protein [Gemmataceae bacterium]|nr:FHA domain-containing protein [Gemmataceae bacterium]
MEVKLLAIEGARGIQTIRLQTPETVVGRQKGCGLRIPSATVSRRHCLLRIQADGLTVEDLGSANGSFVNGARVTGVQSIRNGDELQIGPVTFRVEFSARGRASDRHPPPLPVEPAPLSADPMPLVSPSEFVEAVPLDGAAAGGEFVEAIPLGDPVTGAISDTVRTTTEPQPAPEAGEPANEPLAEDFSWELPEGQDLNDILSRLEGK